jgi:hypothetical protein
MPSSGGIFGSLRRLSKEKPRVNGSYTHLQCPQEEEACRAQIKEKLLCTGMAVAFVQVHQTTEDQRQGAEVAK